MCATISQAFFQYVNAEKGSGRRLSHSVRKREKACSLMDCERIKTDMVATEDRVRLFLIHILSVLCRKSNTYRMWLRYRTNVCRADELSRCSVKTVNLNAKYKNRHRCFRETFPQSIPFL